jgi:secretion/DNA translocation related TadE-like protein
MIAAVLAVSLGAVYVGCAVIARHRAEAAADLAALAAAGRLAQGTEAACAHASEIAQAMQTRIADCVVDRLDVIVTVDVSVALGRIAAGSAHGIARAGPMTQT